jgi:CubicO group peptidase (beta-lactamase class C family)
MGSSGPLEAVASWGHVAAAGWLSLSGESTVGPSAEVFAWASVTKVVTAMAVWVAVEEGTVTLDDPAGPPGSTLRHLLAHASGLAPDGDTVLAPPGRRRIYSNRGIELAATHLASAAGIPFGDYAREAVTEPLGMTGTVLGGSPAHGASGPLGDLLLLARELLRPTLVSTATLAEAASVAFPGLGGVLPGFGRQRENDWGLGVEIRDHKSPHWTGRLNSPATFGHFGQSGSFIWVDPGAGLALAEVSGKPFGPWAASAWPELSDAVLNARLAGAL